LGKYEASFGLLGAGIVPRDVPNAEVHIVDGGHFALDTAADEYCGAWVGQFMKECRNEYADSRSIREFNLVKSMIL